MLTSLEGRTHVFISRDDQNQTPPLLLLSPRQLLILQHCRCSDHVANGDLASQILTTKHRADETTMECSRFGTYSGLWDSIDHRYHASYPYCIRRKHVDMEKTRRTFADSLYPLAEYICNLRRRANKTNQNSTPKP